MTPRWFNVGMDVVVIETPQLGDRSYLVHDGTVALVIDPSATLTGLKLLHLPRASGSRTSPKPTCTTTM